MVKSWAKLQPRTEALLKALITKRAGTKDVNIYIHTYHSRFVPEGVEEVSQIYPLDIHVLPKLVSYEEYCRHDRW
jgi:hypothetical protein